jgi:aspartate/methionine/tyrosine aminotransferase
VGLFDAVPRQRSLGLGAGPPAAFGAGPSLAGVRGDYLPVVDEWMLDVYARAHNPDDPFELRDLWLGRVEHALGAHALRPALAERWQSTRTRREVGPDDVLGRRATVRFVKELFNTFFRDDVYGELRAQAQIILSGGTADEQIWGLPETLKQCIRFALERDWYGYSDSRGRVPAREAVAAYENARIDGEPYDARNVALTLGGTFAVSTITDFLLLGAPPTQSPVLCGIPNYPPLVEAVARRRPTRLVPLPSQGGFTSVDGLITALTPTTPLVMLQTALNPTGAAVTDEELERLVRAASPSTMVLLDECHEWLGPQHRRSRLRATANVIRVSSLSKPWSAPGLKVGWIVADARVVDAYYEYASTTFGGPPSLFYTLVEVLARMERWFIMGVEAPGPTEAAELEGSYDLSLGRLRAAYRSYRLDRLGRERDLTTIREAAVAGLAEASACVIQPRYSINVAAELPGWVDSYLCFRDLLRLTGVSVFPGILTFCLSGGVVRVTTARRWADLSCAISRIRSVLLEESVTSA